ncbi:MAG TPA: tannase/feruloyl esterase family alpha/beta hydrolase [Terriglobales bacterium]|jgi:feruloyl esterase|nr:tannase/feruloyl esterase family alpha/beta hydrolase [Terriglobales bacterium]
MRRSFAGFAFLALLSTGACHQDSRASNPCNRLADAEISGAKIISADVVVPGGFTPAPSNDDGALYKTLPAFCRVQAEATPSSDSHIKIEVWLPQTQTNGRFLAVGNGGFAGDINYHEMALAVAKGYSTASTDTGHTGTALDASWALGHPEKIVDFGHRGIHEMTRVAKAVVKASSGSDPKKSYFAGCSNGGRQALMEAQRYPDDYDGILAGAPANYWTHLVTGSVWDAQATSALPDSYIPASKIPAIASAVDAACDAADGVRDGVVNDPRQCHFRPSSLKCKGADTDRCLTAPQVVALEKLYGGARDSHGGQIFPGLMPGAEEGEGGWGLWITGTAPEKGLLFYFGSGFFANMVYGKADWDFKQASIDDIVKAADSNIAQTLNATDANLKPFAARGGKLLLYHGWNDPAISPLNTVNYYNDVVSALGQGDTDASLRLYMVPGMQHCAGGPGTDSFGQSGTTAQADPSHDAQLALEQWVEKGTAPSEMIAAKYVDKAVKMTRPLCAYPRVAKYKGKGSTDDAASFICSD